jgi:hypothetical protein
MPGFSQEVLAEMIGTTGPCELFIDKFIKVGFIEYDGSYSGGLKIPASLFSVVLLLPLGGRLSEFQPRISAGRPRTDTQNRACHVSDVRCGNIKRVASAVGEGSIGMSFVHRVLGE